MSKTPTSQITFLYFDDMPKARRFFLKTLGLEQVFDLEWVAIFKVFGNAYLGAVDASRSSIKVVHRGGSLISLTVDDVTFWHKKIKKAPLEHVTEIKAIEEIGLKSFFFKGPEGYDFEIQEFTNPDLKKLF